MIHVQTCQPATRWNPPPASFTSLDLEPTGLYAPTRVTMTHTKVRAAVGSKSYLGEAARAARYPIDDSIKGAPIVLRPVPLGLNNLLRAYFFNMELQPLGPERTSVQIDGTNRLRSTIHQIERWIKANGMQAKGWRVRYVSRHPEDGLPRIWITPPKTQGLQ